MESIDKNIKKNNNYDKEVEKLVLSFFESYYTSQRLKLYSFLDTSFQRAVPLNYFLIHPDYDIDIGRLVEITKILVDKNKNIAVVECIIEIRNKKREMVITAKSDFGGWKIEGESIFNGLY